MLSGAVIFCALFSGCACMGNDSRIQGCDSLIKTSGDHFELAGLSIPIGGSTPIKIGNVEYTQNQFQQLTDEAEKLEIYKQGQCALASVALATHATYAQIEPLLFKIESANEKEYALRQSVQQAGTADEAISATKKAATQVKDESTPPQNPPSSPPSGYDDSHIRELLIRVTDLEEKLNDSSFAELTGTLQRLEKNYAKSSSNSIYTEKLVTISGFERNADAMTPRMISALQNELSFLRQKDVKYNSTVFFVIGYADSSGAYLQNIRLGLARAKTVANFLERQSLSSKVTIRATASGGVTNTGGPGARKVEVLIKAWQALPNPNLL